MVQMMQRPSLGHCEPRGTVLFPSTASACPCLAQVCFLWEQTGRCEWKRKLRTPMEERREVRCTPGVFLQTPASWEVSEGGLTPWQRQSQTLTVDFYQVDTEVPEALSLGQDGLHSLLLPRLLGQ